MEFILRQIHKAGTFGWLYMLNLFLGFHFFSIEFINSSYLSTFFDETSIGMFYTVAASLGLVLVASAALFLRTLGNYKTALAAAVLDLLVVTGMALTTDPGMLVVYFCLHTCLMPVMLFSLDVFLEHQTTDDTTTGNTRGIFLSVSTVAALFAPALAGHLIGDAGAYTRVYVMSACFLIPFILVLLARFRSFHDPAYHIFYPLRTLRAVFENRDIMRIVITQFLMRLYFAWNVIYLPLYLHTHIGFTWPEIGTVLFIMLLPYVLVEWPAGMAADTWLGEKELLVAGFTITVVATIGMYLLEVPSVALWGAVLFITRIGLALIESMTETYFFKKIHDNDTDLLAVFRIVRPLAYTIGPVIATVVLIYTDLRHLWLVLACAMLVGIWHAAKIRDTK